MFPALHFSVTNGGSHMDEVEDGELYRRGSDLHSSSLHSYLHDRLVLLRCSFSSSDFTFRRLSSVFIQGGSKKKKKVLCVGSCFENLL